MKAVKNWWTGYCPKTMRHYERRLLCEYGNIKEEDLEIGNIVIGETSEDYIHTICVGKVILFYSNI
jgi:hypothetical protein